MKSLSTLSSQQAIYNALIQCRAGTLELFNGINSETFSQQSHPDFSPVGWHLGHIALTEAYWILEYLADKQPLFPEYQQLFTADGFPKNQRQNLPDFTVIAEYLSIVRNQVLDYLQTAPLKQQERIWWWLIQHESQHRETITFVLEMHRLKQNKFLPLAEADCLSDSNFSEEMVLVEAGEYLIGNESIQAQDNEGAVHKIYLDNYWIDAYPVTCQQYQKFILAGGYKNSNYWSKEGWQWLQKNPTSQPLYWYDSPKFNQHPVCGINYYEAEAYANFVKKRLPTEIEWEKAASIEPEKHIVSLSCNHNNQIGGTTPVGNYANNKTLYGCYDMLGNVWEWTSSWFSGYQGFQSYPYSGYSQVYFDNKHKVLRGGSWATPPWGLRSTFRNWYHPWVRQIFAGFRCVRDCDLSPK